jgi:hypothetical protein
MLQLFAAVVGGVLGDDAKTKDYLTRRLNVQWISIMQILVLTVPLGIQRLRMATFLRLSCGPIVENCRARLRYRNYYLVIPEEVTSSNKNLEK